MPNVGQFQIPRFPNDSCWFVVFLFLLVCFCGLFCVFGFLAGTAYWTAYRSTTSTFVAIDKLTAVHDNYNSSFATIERV